jgi:prevent-host-death family protein
MRHVGIAELKARLSEHIRYVRAGHEVTVLDRERPVARIVPFAQSGALRIRRPRGERRVQDVPMPEEALDLGFDVVDLVIEDRDPDR